ncbi:MAG: hypothetical protein AAGG72_08640, partial [Pseudomonadota bacterium]
TGGTAITLIAMVALASAGAIAFRQYTATDAVVWLLLGLAAYNVSNVAWIALIGQTGLGRATVYAAACQIIFLTVASALLGDAVGRWGWVAAALAGLAVLVPSLPDDASRSTHTLPASSSKSTQNTEENVDA